MTWLISYAAQVLREEIEEVAVAPRVERDRVQVEEVEGAVRVVRRPGVGVPQRDVAVCVPLEHHEPGRDVDLLKDRVLEDAVAAAARRGQVCGDERVRGEEGGARRRDLELVQVGLVAVAGVDGGDRLVGGAHDLVVPEADAEFRGHEAVPPREDRLSLEALDLEVRRRHALRHRVKPDEPSLRVEDHRPGLAVPVRRRQEDVTRRGPRVGGDLHDRRFQTWLGDEALFEPVPAQFHRFAEAHLVGREARDRERRADARGVSLRPDERARGHALALGEVVIDDEARPRRADISPQVTAVGARARAAHAHGGDLVGRHAEEADLRVRRGVRSAVEWRDRDRGVRGACAERAGRESHEHGERRADDRDRSAQLPCALVHLRLSALVPPPAGLAVEPSRRQCHEHGRRDEVAAGVPSG